MHGKFKQIKKIEALLGETLCFERLALMPEIVEIKQQLERKHPGEKTGYRLKTIEKRLIVSLEEKKRREENRPKFNYNNELPITARKDEIISAIRENPVVIVSGETGSGKTTQIPKFCLAAGQGLSGMIGCTQPRRIAAITVARRISEELGEETGQSVGYQIRFRSRTGPRTYIKIMTDGILLSETQKDAVLSRYDTIIVDEAHERSLNIDFVLGILKSVLAKRKDLKVVITSATIDTEKFSRAFGNAPIIEVSGRMYPVETRYLPLEAEGAHADEQTFIDRAVRAVEDLLKAGPYGDILVFMPTEQSIRETVDLFEGKAFKGVTLLPLFARLSAAEQQKVFRRLSGRKIIVATNIAETSITIPGIRYVVDTGLARISQYSPRTRTTALPVLPISRSSADQRKGRCGRVEHGVCLRLYSEDDYASRPLFTLPEILRSNLAEVILRMLALKLGSISDFPFIDRPTAKSIQDGFDLLVELGAIVRKTGKPKPFDNEAHVLTRTGRLMAKLPLDPRLSRMLIEARSEECLEEMVVIASALSIQDPRERPAEKSAEADRAQAGFMEPASDFLTLLNIWKKYELVFKQEKGLGGLKRFCKQHFLSFNRMREWRDIHMQIWGILKEQYFIREMKRRVKKESRQVRKKSDKKEQYHSRYIAIHRSILSGFLSNICVKQEKNVFKATKNRDVMVFPGSALFNKAGEWVVAAEMVKTSRLFIRTVANIDKAWLESLGGNLCRYTYLNPHWERNRGEVVASEQVSLFGLIIVPQRPVGFGRINPQEASDIFIQSALVAGDLKEPFPFVVHNRQLIGRIKNMEDRFRRRDLLVSEDDLFAFYRKRLSKLYDLRSLKKYLKETGSDRFLRMKEKDLLRYAPDSSELALYPDKFSTDRKTLLYRYRFEPGALDDGVTVSVPSHLSSEIPSEKIDWIVPGLLKEKITALIKGLPKAYRTRLMPVNRVVDTVVAEMPKEKGNLATALSNFIADRFGHSIPASAWPLDNLPDHLKMRIEIIDREGSVLDAGRDKKILYRKIREKNHLDELEKARQKWERDHITAWDFGDLPESVTIEGKKDNHWTAYIAVVQEPRDNKSVGLRLFRHPEEAEQAHLKGIAALFNIVLSSELKFLKKMLRLSGKHRAMADYFGGAALFEKQLFESLKQDMFEKNFRTAKEFNAQVKSVRPAMMRNCREKLEKVLGVIEAYHHTRTVLFRLEETGRHSKKIMTFLTALRDELTRLVPENFIKLYDDGRMTHLVRYVSAISIRAERGLTNFEKDRERSKTLIHYQERLLVLLKTLSPMTSSEKRKAVEEFFWLLEEYKVSLFAQELKTAFPVSQKRLNRKLMEIEKML